MAQKEQKIVIDGITFQVGPFMAVEGLKLKAHLVRTFGPALGEFLGGIDGKDVAALLTSISEAAVLPRGLKSCWNSWTKTALSRLSNGYSPVLLLIGTKAEKVTRLRSGKTLRPRCKLYLSGDYFRFIRSSGLS